MRPPDDPISQPADAYHASHKQPQLPHTNSDRSCRNRANRLTPTNEMLVYTGHMVTVYTGEMGDTFAKKGFVALSMLHVS
jgi:hypothetical protein